jgi:hypothetical protein
MSIYLSSDLTTLEKFKRITKMKITFKIVRSPSIFGGSGGQALIIRLINKIAHLTSSQPSTEKYKFSPAEGSQTQSPGAFSSQVAGPGFEPSIQIIPHLLNSGGFHRQPRGNEHTQETTRVARIIFKE